MKKIVVVSAALAALIVLLISQSDRLQKAREVAPALTKKADLSQNTSTTLASKKPQAADARPKTAKLKDPSQTESLLSDTPEDKALLSLVKGLREFSRQKKTSADVEGYLKGLGLSPMIKKDSNDTTGVMYLIRTKNKLPGTRYFHAQVFGDVGEDQFIQHVSFEFKPGPDSMQKAKEVVKSIFAIKKPPLSEKNDFVAWKIENDYEVWIKVLDQKDLQNNPFNAYTKADVGSVRVALEASIH